MQAIHVTKLAAKKLPSCQRWAAPTFILAAPHGSVCTTADHCVHAWLYSPWTTCSKLWKMQIFKNMYIYLNIFRMCLNLYHLNHTNTNTFKKITHDRESPTFIDGERQQSI